jgi:murein DD-endopeptidase MepM/ murein hydrolase activator NlpD
MTSRRAPLLLLTSIALVLLGCETAPPPPPTTTTVPGVVRDLTFPVDGEVSFTDTFGAPRSGGRTHQGIDLMGAKMTPLVAAADGTVTALRHDSTGLSGNSLTITDADGWKYVYIHINNDTPGTDDGTNLFKYAFVAGLAKGSKVTAGQRIAYMGDSGNAEDAGSHLHFELHQPDGTVLNPYQSLVLVK